MRTDDFRLLDMLVAARKLQRFTAGMTLEDFRESELQVIGEAARSLTSAARTQHDEIEWPVIVGLRNRVIHEYYSIRLEIVWEIVRDDIPPLLSYLEKHVAPGDEG